VESRIIKGCDCSGGGFQSLKSSSKIFSDRDDQRRGGLSRPVDKEMPGVSAGPLKRCLSGRLAAALQRREISLIIKKYMDVYNGRDGFTEIDQQWTTKYAMCANGLPSAASDRRNRWSRWSFFSDSAVNPEGRRNAGLYDFSLRLAIISISNGTTSGHGPSVRRP
jgi:hypothetical protein